MRISLFNNFGAKNSAPVFQAIAQGLLAAGHSIVNHDNSADVAVIWSMLWTGRMRGNREVYHTFRSQGRPVIVAEVGMIQRNKTWKLGINGTGFANYPTHVDDGNRAVKLGIHCGAWRSAGSNIVIACQRTDSEQWSGQPTLTDWLSNTVHTIRQHTDRPIVIRPHPRGQAVNMPGYIIERPQQIYNTYDDFDYMKSLDNAWAVVNYNSGPGPQAVIAGVPAFVDSSSLASPVGNLDLKDIDCPARPDRTEWANWLAHSEWTTEEIATGYPLQRLLNTL